MNAIPAIFVSHGAPTLLIDAGPTPAFLKTLGGMLTRPRVVLCISAHWETSSPKLTGASNPETIHDFYGFPDRLYEIHYAAPGSPVFAKQVATLLRDAGYEASIDETRGLDHGAWVPLKLMYPDADIPVVQLSVQTHLGVRHHLELGRALRALRAEGVLILGSGGVTHNLREFRGQSIDAIPLDYVQAFDGWLEDAVTHGREDVLIDFETHAPSAQRNHPTREHFVPLFVPMGAAGKSARGRKLHHAFTYGVLSMAAYAWD